MTACTSLLSLQHLTISPIGSERYLARAPLLPLSYDINTSWRIPFVNHRNTTQPLSSHIWHDIKHDARHKARQQRQRQRAGVRQLLQYLLGSLGIDDVLDDQQFPYRLAKTRYYVCFSHSQTWVAVALSRTQAIGIDVEVQPVKWQLAKRFYHADDIRQLESLPTDQRTQVSQWLWQIKESGIKIHQYTLAQGLGIYYPDLVAALIRASTASSDAPMLFTAHNHTIYITHNPSTTVVYTCAS